LELDVCCSLNLNEPDLSAEMLTIMSPAAPILCEAESDRRSIWMTSSPSSHPVISTPLTSITVF
jgi:hypothetical protein